MVSKKISNLLDFEHEQLLKIEAKEVLEKFEPKPAKKVQKLGLENIKKQFKK